MSGKCCMCNWNPAGERGLCPKCEEKAGKERPCALCRNVEKVPWDIGGRRTALRCMAPGPRQNRVAGIFDKKYPREPYYTAAPPWCPGFESYNN